MNWIHNILKGAKPTMTTFLSLPSPSCVSLMSKETYRFCSVASIHSRKSHVKEFNFRVRAVKEKTEEIKSPLQPPSPEEVTKKYGLEAGLWKVPISFSYPFWLILGLCGYKKLSISITKNEKSLFFLWLPVYVTFGSKLTIFLALNANKCIVSYFINLL